MNWAGQMDGALGTTSGHDHDGTNSKLITASVTYGVVGEMAAAGTAASNTVGIVAKVSRVDHVHALGTHTHTSATTGGTLGTTAFPADTFTANAAGRLPFQDGIWTTAKMAAGLLSADDTGRALFAAGVLNVVTFQSAVAAGILTADVTGRAFMVTGYFNAATVLAKFAANSFDATACASVFADSAIPGSKVNFSFGETPQAEACDASGAEGTSGNVARADHVHAITCAAPSAGLAAADAEGAASTFARSNHVHKAVVTDNVSFFFGASDDCGILFSTTPLQDAMVIFADDVSRSIHICDATGKAVDFNVAVATNPTVYIHNAGSPATDYLKISVDGTTATIQAVGNTLDLTAVGSVTVNEASADVDFRVESNDRQYMFAVDAAKNSIIIGDNADNTSASSMLLISRVAHTGLTAATYSDFRVSPAGAYTTLGDASTYPVIASARFDEPNITVGAGDTVSVAATVYISGAPTEGSANYALDVASGATLLQALTLAGSPLNFTAGAGFVLGTTDNQTLTVKTNAVNKFGFTLTLGQFTVYQAAANYTLIFSDPAAGRNVTFADPLGHDSVAYLAAAQTLTNKTLGAVTINAGPWNVTGVGATWVLGTTDAQAISYKTNAIVRLTINTSAAAGTAGILSSEGFLFDKTVAMSIINDSGPAAPASVQIYSSAAGVFDLATGAGNNVTAVKRISISNAATAVLTLTNVTVTGLSLSGNLTIGAGKEFVIAAGVANAFNMGDGTGGFYNVLTQLTTDNIWTHEFRGRDITIANVAGTTYGKMRLVGQTVTLSAVTGVTAMNGLQLTLESPTIAQSGGAVTVGIASTLMLYRVTAGALVTITNNYIINTDVAGCFLTAAGVWTDACSIEHKTGIKDVALAAIPKLLDTLRVVTYHRKDSSDGGFERFGCLAEEVPDFLAQKSRLGIAAMDMAGFALAAIKWLKSENERLTGRVRVLEAKLA